MNPFKRNFAAARLGGRILAAGLLLSLALLAAGCGDDGDDDGGASAAAGGGGETARAEYIQEADATCTKLNAQIQRKLVPYLRKGVDGSSEAELAEEMVNEVLGPQLMHEIRSVRAIVLPESDSDDVAQVLTSMQEVVEGAEGDPLAFVRTERPFAESEQLARQYGFSVCGTF